MRRDNIFGIKRDPNIALFKLKLEVAERKKYYETLKDKYTVFLYCIAKI